MAHAHETRGRSSAFGVVIVCQIHDCLVMHTEDLSSLHRSQFGLRWPKNWDGLRSQKWEKKHTYAACFSAHPYSRVSQWQYSDGQGTGFPYLDSLYWFQIYNPMNHPGCPCPCPCILGSEIKILLICTRNSNDLCFVCFNPRFMNYNPSNQGSFDFGTYNAYMYLLHIIYIHIYV